eukprot:gene244-294_t
MVATPWSLHVNNGLRTLLRGLVDVVCAYVEGSIAVHSLTAIKWILRVFAFGDKVTSRLPRFFGVQDLRAVRFFLQNKLAKVNVVVREQVLAGLTPLVLACVDPEASPGDSLQSPSMLLHVLRLCRDIGWTSVLRTCGVGVGGDSKQQPNERQENIKTEEDGDGDGFEFNEEDIDGDGVGNEEVGDGPGPGQGEGAGVGVGV